MSGCCRSRAPSHLLFLERPKRGWKAQGKNNFELLSSSVIQRCTGTHGGEPKGKLVPRAAGENWETLAVEVVPGRV